MPLLELTVPRDALDSGALDDLVDNLTRIILRCEGAPRGSDLARQVTWVDVQEVDAYVAGKPAEQPRYRVVATVPEGALSAEAKARFIKETTQAVVAADGSDEPGVAFRVWCIINEVPDGNWGADGRVFTFQDIVELIVKDPALAGAPQRTSTTAGG